MKVHRWLAALGSALILVLSPLGVRALHAQTLTITGCATFTYNGGSGTGTISITCNPTSTPPAAGAPTCQSLTVSPPNDSTPSATLTLTASCTAGSNPIASYTLTGPGITPPGLTQTVASLGPAANTFTVTPPPTATTTYSVTATDGTLASNAATGIYTVGSTSTGPVDMSACTAAGFTGVLVDLPYSVVQNQRVSSTGFGSANALVVRFTVPSVTSDTAAINIVQGGTSQQINHLATLSALPCQFATQAAPTGSVLAAAVGTSPIFYLGVNVPVSTIFGTTTPTLLQPGTTYFLTIVNRNGYYGSPLFTNSCASAGRCDVNINFSN